MVVSTIKNGKGRHEREIGSGSAAPTQDIRNSGKKEKTSSLAINQSINQFFIKTRLKKKKHQVGIRTTHSAYNTKVNYLLISIKMSIHMYLYDVALVKSYACVASVSNRVVLRKIGA